MGCHTVIDCDRRPFVPIGLKIEDHRALGQIPWSSSRVELLERSQYFGDIKTLCEALQDKKILNASFLDFLIGHPELIPPAWKGLSIFFLGTTYFSSAGDVYVRCLRCPGHWGWEALWWRNMWHSHYRVALLAD